MCDPHETACLKKARSRRGTRDEVFDAQKTRQWCTDFWAVVGTAARPIIAFWAKALTARGFLKRKNLNSLLVNREYPNRFSFSGITQSFRIRFGGYLRPAPLARPRKRDWFFTAIQIHTGDCRERRKIICSLGFGWCSSFGQTQRNQACREAANRNDQPWKMRGIEVIISSISFQVHQDLLSRGPRETLQF